MENGGKGDARRVELSRPLVESAKPTAERYRIHDTRQPGLFLRVYPSGVKTWNVAWARNRSMRIGVYPNLTVAGARERARQVLVERDAAGAPAGARAAKTAPTLRVFIDERYAPWVRLNRRRPKEELKALKASFEAEFYDIPLDQIDVDAVAKWMVAQQSTPSRITKRKRSAASVRRAVARLKGLLSRAAEWTIIEASPLAKLKLGRDVSRGVVRYLLPHEDSALRAALAARDMHLITAREKANSWREQRSYELLPELIDYADHMTPLVLFAVNTGLRRGELTQIVWRDINLDARVIYVRAEIAKSARARFVPLNAEAISTLQRWRGDEKVQPTDRVFPVDDAKKGFAAVLKAAGVLHFRFHDLRHTFASRLALAGVSLYTIGELLGHADAETTKRYAHLSAGHLAAAVELLEPKSGPQAVPTLIAEQK
jgi:integrase